MYGTSRDTSPNGLGVDTRDLQCLHCGSSEQIVIESIESLPPHPGELLVQVGYVCRKCQGNYLHAARFRDVAGILNKSRSFVGLLRFAGKYFHCGETMKPTGSDTKSVYAPLTTDDAGVAISAVSVATTVLRCQCGFRLEVPA